MKVFYIMGVSGSGKTTIGQALSAATGYHFYDADDFHTEANKEKMNAGTPLIDEDRWPWLKNIHDFVSEKIGVESIIVGCSALKKIYREKLCKSIEDNCIFIFLQGDYNTIHERLENRHGHYMPPALLQSQFDALEPPANAINVDIKQPVQKIVDDIVLKISW